MAVRVITAPPGMGKTLNMTRLARELFREDNNIKFGKQIIKGNLVNVIYSNYPIILYTNKKPFKYLNGAGILKDSVPLNKNWDSIKEDEKPFCYGVFSNKIALTDLVITNVFGKNASFFIDEISFMYDSMDYQGRNTFPDSIAHFFSIHRHLEYNMIYTNSQSLSRVIKRVLCVSEEYWNIANFRKILWWGICNFNITYDIKTGKDSENYMNEKFGREEMTKIFLINPVYKSYNSKYLGVLRDSKDARVFDIGEYSSKVLNEVDIYKQFVIPVYKQEELKNMRF